MKLRIRPSMHPKTLSTDPKRPAVPNESGKIRDSADTFLAEMVVLMIVTCSCASL